VVPKKWCHEGDWRESMSEYAVGSCVAISGAKTATAIIPASTIIPPRDFGLASSRSSHDGNPGSLRLGAPAGSSIGTTPPPCPASSTATGWI